jgi:hypothetical protein
MSLYYCPSRWPEMAKYQVILISMVIVSSDLVGYSQSPTVNPADRCDRLDAIDVCFLLEITHAYLRDLCCVSIRYFDERCTAFSVLVPNLQTTDLELGARVTESGYSGREQFLYVFLLRLLSFPSSDRKSFPCCYLTRHESKWGVKSPAAHILNLGTRWGWVVCSTTLLLYVRWKRPRYALNRRLRSSRSRSVRFGEVLSPASDDNRTMILQSYWSLHSTLWPRYDYVFVLYGKGKGAP